MNFDIFCRGNKPWVLFEYNLWCWPSTGCQLLIFARLFALPQVNVLQQVEASREWDHSFDYNRFETICVIHICSTFRFPTGQHPSTGSCSQRMRPQFWLQQIRNHLHRCFQCYLVCPIPDTLGLGTRQLNLKDPSVQQYTIWTNCSSLHNFSIFEPFINT